MKNFSLLFLNFIALVSLVSCSTDKDTADPKKSFVKIYNETSFSNAITAIDLVETEKGYLILATNKIPDEQFPGVTLLAIDKEGKVLNQTTLGTNFVSPAKGMFTSDTNYRFLCMGANTQGYILEVNASGALINETPLAITYPLCSGLATDGNYLIQGYSQADRTTILTKISSAGLGRIFEHSYTVLESVDEYIFNHLSGNGKRYPFSVGQTNTHYYFNGFRNFTFSLVFVDPSTQIQSGVVNGYQYSGGFSSAVPIEGNTFALSRFYFGANYFIPKQALTPTATSVSKDIEGRNMLELEPDAAVSLNRLTINGRKILIYASNTINKQIGLYAYDETSGDFIKAKYFGFSVPCEFGALTLTSDGGLLMTGSAYVDGRFKRICAFKLAQSELEEMIK